MIQHFAHQDPVLLESALDDLHHEGQKYSIQAFRYDSRKLSQTYKWFTSPIMKTADGENYELFIFCFSIFYTFIFKLIYLLCIIYFMFIYCTDYMLSLQVSIWCTSSLYTVCHMESVQLAQNCNCRITKPANNQTIIPIKILVLNTALCNCITNE